MYPYCLTFFFFNDTATTEIYTLSLHDALPISAPQDHSPGGRGDLGEDPLGLLAVGPRVGQPRGRDDAADRVGHRAERRHQDRKSTRLNSSHANISYAVFCLKKKKTQRNTKSYS